MWGLWCMVDVIHVLYGGMMQNKVILLAIRHAVALLIYMATRF